MNRIPCEVIVFDQDGTLVDTDYYVCEVFAKMEESIKPIIKNYGLKIGEKRLINAWEMLEEKEKHVSYSHLLQEETVVIKSLNLLHIAPEIIYQLSLDLLKLYRQELRKLLEEDKVRQEVVSVLKTLQSMKKRLGVFSNSSRDNLNNNMRFMGYDKFFSCLHDSEDNWEDIQNYYHCPVNQIVYVGDDPITDIESAKKFGMKAFLVAPDNKVKDWLEKTENSYMPDAVIHNFSQISQLIS